MALALVDDGKHLLVANRKSGSVSVIDLSTRQVTGETYVGRRISDLAIIPGGQYLLATDEAADELILLNRDGRKPSRVCRLHAGRSPVSVRLTLDGSRTYVASLWSRQISIVDVTLGEAKSQRLTLRGTIDLPFAPRGQLLVEDGKQLLVADAFGGKLAVVDLTAPAGANGSFVAGAQYPGHGGSSGDHPSALSPLPGGERGGELAPRAPDAQWPGDREPGRRALGKFDHQ